MIFPRLVSVVLVLSVLLLGNTTFAATQNQTDSLNRLNAQVSVQGLSLDDASKSNIQNSCQTAQANIKSLRQKEQRIQRERLETYTDVQNEIDALRLRLMRQGIDAGGVGRVLLGYREQTDQYDRLSKSYYEALNDTVTIDCRENPEAFIAGLTLLRQKRALLLDITNTLHDFVYNTVQGQFNIVKKDIKV